MSLGVKSSNIRIASYTNDGMDLALCSIDKATLTLEFGGSYRPVFIYRGKELIEIKGDKKFISELPEEKQEYAEQLKEKFKEIEKAAQKKFTEAEVKECENFESMQKKYDSL